MNLDTLYDILRDCTVQLRKGPPVVEEKVGPLNVTHLYDMAHDLELGEEGIQRVDVHFIVIGVHMAKAERHKAQLIEILKGYPQPERLQGGPSYIEVGAVIGDQGAAFQLFALGEVCGLWKVITPETLGFTGSFAHDMAGRGMVMMSGYNVQVAA